MAAGLRMVGIWVVTTALIVLGVNAAIERVARDVAIARPAPLAPSEVGELLRDDNATTTTELDPPSTAGTGATTTSPAGTSPAATPTTGSPDVPEGPDVPGSNPTDGSEGPDLPRPTQPGGQPDDAGTTTTPTRDTPGRPDVRAEPRGP